MIPNLITLARIALTVLFVFFAATQARIAALVCFAVAALSDLLDGFFARRLHQESKLGAFLDPIADKILVVAAFVILAMHGILPWWLLVVIVVREVGIACGTILFARGVVAYTPRPNYLSKAATACEIALGSLGLAAFFFSFSIPYISFMAIFVAVCSLGSGVSYLVRELRRTGR